MAEKPRVVIDTQIVLRAAINLRSLPARIIFDLGDSYELVISPAIRAEIYDVLNRPELRSKFSTLTDAIVENVLQLIDAGQWVTPQDVLSVSRDPKDDMFLACALAGQAAYILSVDHDLLDLGSYQGIHIVSVQEFLSKLQA